MSLDLVEVAESDDEEVEHSRSTLGTDSDSESGPNASLHNSISISQENNVQENPIEEQFPGTERDNESNMETRHDNHMTTHTGETEKPIQCMYSDKVKSPTINRETITPTSVDYNHRISSSQPVIQSSSTTLRKRNLSTSPQNTTDNHTRKAPKVNNIFLV